MKIEGSELIFSTGRRAYANQGIIGLSPTLHPFGGYDQEISNDPFEEDRITPAEWRELAECMISQWQAFAEKHRQDDAA